MSGFSRSSRDATPARWQAALERAVAGGLEIFIAADTGERFVTSASRLDTLHRTDGYTCSCEAGVAGDAVCSHRAIVRYVMGWLPDVAAPLVPCTSCTGGKVETYAPRSWVPMGYAECSVCNGTGMRPALVSVAASTAGDLDLAA